MHDRIIFMYKSITSENKKLNIPFDDRSPCSHFMIVYIHIINEFGYNSCVLNIAKLRMYSICIRKQSRIVTHF